MCFDVEFLRFGRFYFGNVFFLDVDVAVDDGCVIVLGNDICGKD